MALIALSDYQPQRAEDDVGLEPFSFTLRAGDLYAVEADTLVSGQLFLRALATLVHPRQGTYAFDGRELKFARHDLLLPVKRKIGYIASDATLISNRTLRENLLMMRYYFENSFALQLDPKVTALCRMFNLLDKLDRRPAELDPQDRRTAIAIRELSKPPLIMLMERPEDFLSEHHLERFIDLLELLVLQKVPLVFISDHNLFSDRFGGHTVRITEGKLSTVAYHTR